MIGCVAKDVAIFLFGAISGVVSLQQPPCIADLALPATCGMSNSLCLPRFKVG